MKKIKRKVKINYLFLLAIGSLIIGSFVILHDIIFYIIIPFSTGDFYMITYLGMFIDISALFLIEASLQYIESIIKDS